MVLAADCWSSTLLLIFFLTISLQMLALWGLLLLRVITTWYPTLNLSVINSRLPTIINFPCDIIAILLDNYSAYYKWWVVKIIQRFSLSIVFKISQIDCLEFGSNPELGSSKNINLDPPIRLFAKHNLRLFPPDKFLANFPL